MNVDWDTRFMELARHIGAWSKDRSRRVGCVIVGSRNEIRTTGYNGFPRGIEDEVPNRHERPGQYKWTEHAERSRLRQDAFLA
jgi:dCMP deaminase